MVAVVFVLAGGVSMASPSAAAACTGTGPIEITSLTFDPPAVGQGQLSTATMVAQNCTDQAISTVSLWSARYIGGTPLPPGCPALDPLGLPANFAPLGQVTSRITYLALQMCTASGLTVTVNIQSGDTRATASATLVIRPSTGTCKVVYHRDSEWATGFTSTVTITNTGTSPINPWQLNFSFAGDQQVTQAWNAVVTQAGAAVTARNAAYNATIAPNAAVSFGMYGTWRLSDAPPTAFTLNGAPCTTG